MTTAISPAFRVSINASQYPSWRAPLAVGQWTMLANTNISTQGGVTHPNFNAVQLGIGPRSLIDTWCGLAIDTDNSIVILNGGGHTDYAGNAVLSLALNVNTPAWSVLRDNTDGSQIPANNTLSYYGDGRPTSTHTYVTLQWAKATKRMMRYGLAARFYDGNKALTVDGFNLLTNDWDASGSHPNLPAGGQGTYYIICQHPTTGFVYYQPQGTDALYKFDPSTNTWSTITTNAVGVFSAYTNAEVDSTRNRILRLGGTVTPAYYDLSNSAAQTNVTLTGIAIPNVSVGQGALTYCADIDRFLYFLADGTQNVYRIHPTTFNVDLFPTSGITPPTTQWQLMNRFKYVPGLKGCIAVTSGTGNVSFLRTS